MGLSSKEICSLKNVAQNIFFAMDRCDGYQRMGHFIDENTEGMEKNKSKASQTLDYATLINQGCFRRVKSLFDAWPCWPTMTIPTAWSLIMISGHKPLLLHFELHFVPKPQIMLAARNNGTVPNCNAVGTNHFNDFEVRLRETMLLSNFGNKR